jgi:NAD(P)-dependent dehydrogenase (short-subunit alcohol dehydrogenase family)
LADRGQRFAGEYRRVHPTIVTGSSRGIGKEIALLLASEGASVIVNDLGVGRGGDGTDQALAAEVGEEITAAGGKAIANFDSVAEWRGREGLQRVLHKGLNTRPHAKR